MDPVVHTDVVRFDCRDMGWYEDDPDYHYHGSVGKAFVDLAIPKLPNGSGVYKVSIVIEEYHDESKADPDHLWTSVGSPDSLDEVCVRCGYVASYYEEEGVMYPFFSCPGEK